MEKIKTHYASKTIEFSEYKNYYELLNRVCYYNYPNGNKVKLDYDDSTLEKAKTLISMPVYAKCTVNSKGEPTFKSHEAYIDDRGDIAFDTMPIGVHTEVYIKDDNVEVDNGVFANTPCLFAKQRIWKRNKNACAAMLRLYELGELHNSWEISSFKYTYDNGIKTLDQYLFDGNTFLGSETSTPAYGNSAKVLEISVKQKKNELLIAEALSKDILETSSDIINKRKENEDLSKEELLNENLENPTEEVSDTSENGISDKVENSDKKLIDEQENTENENNDTDVDEEEAKKRKKCASFDDNDDGKVQSALTDYDLRVAINTACREKFGRWCWATYIFPTEQKVLCEFDGRTSELDYKMFEYQISNDMVTVSDPVDVRLAIEISKINDFVNEKSEALVSANNKIEELKADVNVLFSYKEKVEKIERENAEREKEKNIDELRNYVETSCYFTKEEIESEPICTLISELNKIELKAIIADRVVEKLNKKKDIETSMKKAKVVKAEITYDDGKVDYKSVMSDFFKKK